MGSDKCTPDAAQSSSAAAMDALALLNELTSAGTGYAPVGRDGSQNPPTVVELGSNHRAVVTVVAQKEDGTILLLPSADEDEDVCLPWDDLRKEETIRAAAVRVAAEKAHITLDPLGIVAIENYPSLKKQFFRYTVLGKTVDPESGLGFATGEYTLSKPVSLRTAVSVKSEKLTSIRPGTKVIVTQILRDAPSGSIRAFITAPQSGWITLKTAKGLVTAVRSAGNGADGGDGDEAGSTTSDLLTGGNLAVLEKMRAEMMKKTGKSASVKVMKSTIRLETKKHAEERKAAEAAASVGGSEGSGATTAASTDAKAEQQEKPRWVNTEDAMKLAPAAIGQLEALSRHPKGLDFPAGRMPHAAAYHLVETVCVHEDKALLVRRMDRGKERWMLPATHLDPGDTVSFASSRLTRAFMGLVSFQVGVVRLEHAGMSSKGLDGTVTTVASTVDVLKPDSDFKAEQPPHRWLSETDLESFVKEHKGALGLGVPDAVARAIALVRSLSGGTGKEGEAGPAAAKSGGETVAKSPTRTNTQTARLVEISKAFSA